MFDLSLIEAFKNFPPEFATFLIAMIPVTELRASIPIALVVYELPIWSAIFFSVLGDMVPMFFVLIGVEKIYLFISKKSEKCKKLFDWFFKRTENKFSGKYAKYGAIALIFFVGVPLPFTGSWSGSVAAFLFRIPFYKAFPLIMIGILMAAILVTLITLGFITVF